jgi:hypothetical protein
MEQVVLTPLELSTLWLTARYRIKRGDVNLTFRAIHNKLHFDKRDLVSSAITRVIVFPFRTELDHPQPFIQQQTLLFPTQTRKTIHSFSHTFHNSNIDTIHTISHYLPNLPHFSLIHASPAPQSRQ